MKLRAVTGMISAEDFAAAWATVRNIHPRCDKSRIRIKEDKSRYRDGIRQFAYLVYE